MTGWDDVWRRGSKGRSTFSKPFAAGFQGVQEQLAFPSRTGSQARWVRQLLEDVVVDGEMVMMVMRGDGGRLVGGCDDW